MNRCDLSTATKSSSMFSESAESDNLTSFQRGRAFSLFVELETTASNLSGASLGIIFVKPKDL